MRIRTFLIVMTVILGCCIGGSALAQSNSVSTTTTGETIYSSYSATFYPIQTLWSYMARGGRYGDGRYAQSMALYKGLPESKFRTRKYDDSRKLYDSFGKQIETATKRMNNLRNRYTNINGVRRQNVRNNNNSYDYERQQLNAQLQQAQTKVNNLRVQQKSAYDQMTNEQKSMYTRALGDESYLKKFLESYALAGIKQANQQKNERAQLKAEEEQKKTAEEWQAYVTFEYLSKYSTLREKFDNKQITFTEYENARDKLDKEKNEKLKRTQKEARDAYKETLEQLTTGIDTTIRTPKFN